MKIVQFGLPYSPNVGDGIISETLGHALRAAVPGLDYSSVDISGRAGFGAETVRNRSQALAVLRGLPKRVRGRLVEARLGRMLDRVVPDWTAALEGADLAVLGGGQIFSDADLNFCTKVARVAQVTRAANVPLAICAAGVSQNWSGRGADLFGAVFGADLRLVGLRDAPSIAAWAAQTGGRGPEPVFMRDPGLLAAELYGDPSAPGDVVGLGIAAPELLRYHADTPVTGAEGIAFFANLAAELARRGHKVRLFCNGAAEDAAALAKVAAMPAVAALVAEDRIEVVARPERPADLAAVLRDCGVVVAHRMHACIVAWSYRVPVVGLGWDRKVESFLTSVGDEDSFAGGDAAGVTAVADRAEARLATGIDAATHARVLEETRTGLARLCRL